MKLLRARNIERTFLILIGIVLAFLFIKLFNVLKKDFDEVPVRLADGSMVNLNGDQLDQRIKNLLTKGYYFEDAQDVALAGAAVAKGVGTLSESMDNIGELNKRAFYIPSSEAFAHGGISYKKRAQLSRALIGFTGADSVRYDQELLSPPPLPAVVNIGLGKYTISGDIHSGDNTTASVLVRLQMLLPQDSVYNMETSEVTRNLTQNTSSVKLTYILDSLNNKQLQSLTAYARTDAQGHFSFTGLPDNKTFEVLPLKPGFQFGASKGVQELTKNVSFDFFQAPHVIKLFSTHDFNELRKEKALIVRTPQEFSYWYQIIVISFIAAFLLLHLFLSVRFPQADQFILPVLMLLVGISFLTLLSLQDPLRDRFLARSTLGYFMGGVVCLFIIQLFNLRRFTTDSGFFRLFFFKQKESAANGWPWAIAAVGLLLLTILFGTGPEGSGVKINLFGFQPSEIVKFLVVIFLAGFFTANEKFISEYTRWQKRWSFFSFALIAIAATIMSFLILGDLGPAMVVCFTFIVLFSFSRGDFAFAVATAALYVITIWIVQNLWISTAIIVALLLLASFFLKKGLSESAVMILVVMAGFLLLDKVPFIDQLFPGPVHRLVDRKAIWMDPWNNEVFGGDQIANGIWAMASGGIKGQGIGEGFAKTIPEAHTDMILPSMGEEFGWAGILCVFILFLIYLHRSIIIGRQTGTPFLFYLCAGIGISTFIQFLLIAGGSVGALPLSGVSLPFMSYGGSSLVMNMLAAGFLLSASNVQGSTVQMRYISKQQDRNLVPALVAALIGIVFLSINVSQYLFNNKKWVIQPALVADRSGARMFSYNPRIAILMNKLGAGNLLDRNGQLLATGKPQLILQQEDSLTKAGLNKSGLEALTHKRQDRYYPFADQMFFWTGDANSGIFMGGTNGYFAEYEHQAELRGFPTPTTNYQVVASRYQEARFLPQTAQEMTISKRDYSALAPLLLAGINSKEVDAFKQRNRDVQLTMDAALQTELQQALQSNEELKDSRISVVVMEDKTGDVLASASYPLPAVNEPEKLTLPLPEQNKLSYWITNSDLGFTHATQPGSSAKLITATAAFNKLGMEAARKTILIRPQDLIRIHSDEPDETGNITIERAIVKSNNPFFIKLANEEQLQEEMSDIYLKAGMFLHGVGGYYYEGDLQNITQQNKWKELWRKTEFRSVRRYNPNNIRATRGLGVSGMAWGQGELVATPASIARVASALGNNGVLIPNRYVLKISDSAIGINKGVELAKDPQYARLMTQYMKEQSAGKFSKLGIYVAGKTGTPERIVKGQRINDGWYVFFAPKASGKGHIVTCIRIEDCKGSSVAVKLAGSTVIPILQKKGYLKSFSQHGEEDDQENEHE